MVVITMLNFRFVPLVPLFTLFIASGCSVVALVDNAGDSAGKCGNEGCWQDDVGDGGVSEVSADIGAVPPGETGYTINPMCGVLSCTPDDPLAAKCNAEGPPDAGIDVVVEGGTGPADAVELDAQNDVSGNDSSSGDDDDDSKSLGSEWAFGSSSVFAFNQFDRTVPFDDSPRLACRVTQSSKKGLVSECLEAGSATDGEECETAQDCAAGLACVGREGDGVCRAYCCLGSESCSENTYCTEKLTKNASGSGAILVPVCTPADDCNPLPDDPKLNQCPSGLICSIVRSNGTTACVKPSSAVRGESCDSSTAGKAQCAQGFVCSKRTDTCLALCRLKSPDCEEGVCQGGTSGLPNGYGVCVTTRRNQ